MKGIALITVLFDYPEDWIPKFYDNALNYFNKEDIHIIRHSNLIDTESYYDKLYFYKTVKLLDYIKENIEGRYDFIFFLDATDTNFYGSPDNMINNFKLLNKSIIFCGERGLWPPTNYNYLYENKRVVSPARYLNSGSYFGYVDKISHYLNEIMEKNLCKDDQGSWSIQYLLNEDIEIDQECNFFFSTFNSKEHVQIVDNKVTLVGVNPITIHDNGPYTDDTIKLTDILNK
jgi:hypothetical protein